MVEEVDKSVWEEFWLRPSFHVNLYALGLES